MPQQHGIRTIVGLGLLARAAAGFVLFWISYLRVPIASSLQLGDGFWFFGEDGITYFRSAVDAAQRGVWAIAGMEPRLPSVFFRKILALLVLLFGATPSVALLLNLFSYLALCALLIKLSERVRTRASATVFALIAASFSPTWILWALQPMKEPFFILLIVGFFYAFAVWVDGASAARPSISASLAAAVWMMCLIYAISGIRWYFALILLGASAIVMALVVYQATARWLIPAASGVMLLAALAEVVPFGAGPYTPVWALAVIRPFARPILPRKKAQNIIESMDRARENLYRYNAATDIAIVKRNRFVPDVGSGGGIRRGRGRRARESGALRSGAPNVGG